ncbi:MAG: Tad secretion system protein [Idiomarinaceae bacterium HL-53]|nr:MAG: Tad secretion system protein [Idiomarinaceae bacterium HL-53]CUS48811.1 hypothetical protein Ga0003345_1791 [Idiomarinaceae bacterium HL-53]
MKHLPCLERDGFYESHKLWFPRGFFERALGWFIKPEHFQGVYLERCKAVHSFGMSQTIQLLWVDASGRLLRPPTILKPWRIAFCREAYGVIELIPE